MQYNQPMIDLVYAIRGRLSDSAKRVIKTTNPELLEDLAEIYSASSDAKLCSLIHELLSLAGNTWVDLLHIDAAATDDNSRSNRILLYPGKTALAERASHGESLTSNDADVVSIAPLVSRTSQAAFA